MGYRAWPGRGLYLLRRTCGGDCTGRYERGIIGCLSHGSHGSFVGSGSLAA